MPNKTSTWVLNENNDIDVDADGQLASTTSVAQIVAIRIKARFLTFLGEWYQDETIGLPWLTRILVKGADVTTLNHLFLVELQKVLGVKSVNYVTLNINQKLRKLTMKFSVEAADGTTTETATGAVSRVI